LFRKLRVFDEPKDLVIGTKPEQAVGAPIEAVERWLSRLPKAHAAACRLIYIQGKSQDEVAAEVGCSKSFLSRLHREAVLGLIWNYEQARKND
jgi:DNA-directed RNA polymerase specialized sigma24 family protein